MLNEKAQVIYRYIRERIGDGYAPTVREICAALDIRSTSTVHRYINLLVDEGLLDKMDNQNRAIRLHGSSARNVPLIGTVTAGMPITAIENIEDYLSYIPDRHFTGELFALKIRGESMIKAGILDGDIVIVEQCSTVENGEIAVAMVRDLRPDVVLMDLAMPAMDASSPSEVPSPSLSELWGSVPQSASSLFVSPSPSGSASGSLFGLPSSSLLTRGEKPFLNSHP
ncbi:MAG: repressor LexA, partial [Oscillospiraceae bacterium]|nr:repressor LexA [Oscillospiraceae bacterium]